MIGMVLAALPASLFMQRLGRRAGFIESQAISLVLAGGVVAAFLGPLNASRTTDRIVGIPDRGPLRHRPPADRSNGHPSPTGPSGVVTT